jgi:hypothetical protein
LKISSDSGPSNLRSAPPDEIDQRKPPWPGKLRKWRLQDSTYMSSTGASAICTRKMRSPGIERIADSGVLREQVWKLSSTSPTDLWSARRTTSQASR